jgi:hypothetical protein
VEIGEKTKVQRNEVVAPKDEEEEKGGKHVICRRLLNSTASELGSTGMKARRTEVANMIEF